MTKALPRQAYQALRSRLAAEALAKGEIKVPVRCSWCSSTNVQVDASKEARRKNDRPADYLCVSCGRSTGIADARNLRRQQIRRIILEGIDPPALRKP